jgi:hypothetical protein
VDCGICPEGDWVPPVGTPMPPFGIIETAEGCESCDVETMGSTSDLNGISAGTVINIPAGNYNSSINIRGNGTKSDPIFVRGAGIGETIFNRDTRIEGSYIVVENIEWDFQRNDYSIRLSGDHIVFRHNDVHDLYKPSNTTVVYMSGGNDYIIWDNRIHDNGDFSSEKELDIHGIGGSNFNRAWILENEMFRNRGDSIQFGHRAGNSMQNIYIGRNTISDNGENCVDIKEASNVVISENVLFSSGSYPNVVLHDCPVNAAVIENEIYGARAGVEMGSLESWCAENIVDLFIFRNDLTRGS